MPRDRQVRRCYANQKVLGAAIRQLCSELELSGPDRSLVRIDPILMAFLVERGYIKKMPRDPGKGKGSWQYYTWVPGNRTVTCIDHGSRVRPRILR